jgi:hypothetical protein
MITIWLPCLRFLVEWSRQDPSSPPNLNPAQIGPLIVVCEPGEATGLARARAFEDPSRGRRQSRVSSQPGFPIQVALPTSLPRCLLYCLPGLVSLFLILENNFPKYLTLGNRKGSRENCPLCRLITPKAHALPSWLPILDTLLRYGELGAPSTCQNLFTNTA